MREKVTITRTDDMQIQVASTEGAGTIRSQSVEAHLLFAILEKLEELRCVMIDAEGACDSIRRTGR